MVRCLTALMTTIFIAASAAAQTPQQHLEEARALLRGIAAAPDSDAGKKISILQQQFNEFASDYLMQESRGSVDASDTPPAARQASWRSRYLLVEADLAALLGPANAREAAGIAGALEPQVSDRLQQVRVHLQTFYAATLQSRDGNPVAHTGPSTTDAAPVTPTAAAPQTPAPVRTSTDRTETSVAGTSGAVQEARPCEPVRATSGIDPATALMLLDRIQSVLDESTKDESPTSVAPVGTSGKSDGKRSAAGGKVTMDRGLVDEIRAELNQIKALLKK